MQRAIAAALIALLVLVRPATAQLFGAPGERVVLDAQLNAVPPAESAPCLRLEAGTLTVTTRNLETDNDRPTMFIFTGYRGEDEGAHLNLAVTSTETTARLPLTGAWYCWWLDVDAPVTADDSLSVRTNYSQRVLLRMTYTPSQ